MSEETKGEIIITLASKEVRFSYEKLGVTFESNDAEIIDAVAPVILESEGLNLKEETDGELFTVKKVEESKNCYIFPKSSAG